MLFWLHRRVLPALLIVALAFSVAAIIGQVVSRVSPNTAQATVLAPPAPCTTQEPWLETPYGDLEVMTTVNDTNGLWSASRADSSAEAKAMWLDIKDFNLDQGWLSEEDFQRMVPGQTTYLVPAKRAAQFKSWYAIRNSESAAATTFHAPDTTSTPVAPVRSNRSLPGVAWMLIGFAAAGGALTTGSAYRRILSPSNAHPMRPTPLTNATEAAEVIREQVAALTVRQPTSADALPDLPQWMIVSAVRGLGNGAVESHFADGSSRREYFRDEPCYEVVARNTAGEERRFHIRIQCANQLVGLTGQFALDDFRFTATSDPVAMNLPFVAPPATPDPTPAPAPAAAEPEAAPVTTPVVSGALPEPVAAAPRSITIERGEGNTLTVTTPTGTATITSTDEVVVNANGGQVTVTIGAMVFTTNTPANPTA